MTENLHGFTNLMKDSNLEVHQKMTDSKGEERYVRQDPDDVSQQTTTKAMAAQVAGEIQGQSFTKRLEWIEEQKKKGNELFAAADFENAISQYIKALCGMDFKSFEDVKPVQEKMVGIQLKIPILNNLSLCLQKQNHYERALDMLEQVLKLDESNAKALSRKVTILMQQGQIDKA